MEGYAFPPARNRGVSDVSNASMTMKETADPSAKAERAILTKKRGDSDLSKFSMASFVTFKTEKSVQRSESRMSGKSVQMQGRSGVRDASRPLERKESSSTIASSVLLPKLQTSNAAQRYGDAQSRDQFRRALQRRQLSQLQRSDSRMSMNSATGGGRQKSSFRTMQAVSNFRRKRRVVTLGLEDIMRRNDAEWMQQEMALHQAQPRFSSLLSREAQCLMLKGYEDVVWDRLVHLYPEKRETLARVETPTDLDNLVDALPDIAEAEKADSTPLAGNSLKGSVASLQNTSKKRNAQDDFEAVTRKNSQLSNPDSSITVAVKGRDSKEPQQAQRMESIRSTFTPLQEERDTNGSKPESAGDNQWRVSYRIQNAMDALDKMKIADGEVITSESYKNKQMDPLTFFNYWGRKWREEFPKNVNSLS